MSACRRMPEQLRGPRAARCGTVPACVLLMLLCTPGAAAAQDLRVYVTQNVPAGVAPVGGATVCAGTATEPAKYGRLTTNSGGQVTFTDLPGTQVVITAHKTGFTGQRKTAPAHGNDQFRLQAGTGGPSCPVAPFPTERAQITMTAIRSFTINNDAADVEVGRGVHLWIEWTGAPPTQYRVSERAGFPGASWQRWGPPRPVPGRTWRPGYLFQDQTPGEKTIYVQLRNAHGQTSAIVSDRIRLRAAASAPQAGSCRLEIHRASNALAFEPDPALRETVTIQAGSERRFNSAWPSPNESRRGFGMHVRRLRNVGELSMIVYSTFGAALKPEFFSLTKGQSRDVRFDLDRVVCVQ